METGKLSAWIAAIVFSCSGLPYLDSARGEEPNVRPLVVNSPFAANIQSFDVDHDSDTAVSTSVPRAVTVWTINSQNRLPGRRYGSATIRLPQRPEGLDYTSAPYITAIAPNGEYIALSRPPLGAENWAYRTATAEIVIYKRSSLKQIAILRGDIPTYVRALRFSEDGHYLAAVLGDGCGVRLWHDRSWKTAGSPNILAGEDDKGYGNTQPNSSCRNLPAIQKGLPSDNFDVQFAGRDVDPVWFVTSGDTGVRAYRKKGNAIAASVAVTPANLKIEKPGAVAVSPKHDRIAVADKTGSKIAVLPLQNLNSGPSRILDLTDIQAPEAQSSASFLSLLWQKDGRFDQIYAVGRVARANIKQQYWPAGTGGNNIFFHVVFKISGAQVQKTLFPLGNNSTLFARSARNGGLKVYAALVNEIVAVRLLGEEPRFESEVIARREALDLRQNNVNDAPFLVSRDATRIFLSSFSQTAFQRTVYFDLPSLSFDTKVFDQESEEKYLSEVKAERDKGLSPGIPDQSSEQTLLKHQTLGNESPGFFGKALDVSRYDSREVLWATALFPDGNTLAWSTNRAIRIVDREHNLKCEQPIAATAHRLNVSGDGKFLVSAHADGVVRWYRIDLNAGLDKCLLLALSLYMTENPTGKASGAKDGGELAWLAWREDGKFALSRGANAEDLACFPYEEKWHGVDVVSCLVPRIKYGLSVQDIRNALQVAAPRQQLDERQRQALMTEDSSRKHRYDVDSSVENAPEGKLSEAGAKVKLKFVSDDSDKTQPRYLGVEVNKEPVDVIYSNRKYGPGEAIELIEGQQYQLAVQMPSSAMITSGADFKICYHIYKEVENGIVQKNTALTRGEKEANNPCETLTWNGPAATQNITRKLWAVIVGFSNAGAKIKALKYAHEDALDFARFLQMEYERHSAQEGGLKALGFDDWRIDVLMVETSGDDIMESHPKRRFLSNFKERIKFRLLTAKERAAGYTYVSKVRLMLEEVGKEMLEEKTRNPNEEQELLFYFSGHGYKVKNLDGTQIMLVTPHTVPDNNINTISLDELNSWVNATSGVNKIVILDICRSPIDNRDGGKVLPHASLGEVTLSKATEVLFGVGDGFVAYEVDGTTANSMVRGLTGGDGGLWPPSVESEIASDGSVGKGNGVFTMSLIKSMMCGESHEKYHEEFTLEKAYDFLRLNFFQDGNGEWKVIKSSLMQSLHLPALDAPKPAYHYSSAPFPFYSYTQEKECYPALPR